MTRNEFIAKAALEIDINGWRMEDGKVEAFGTFEQAITLAVAHADALEAAKVAPWQTAPASDTAAKVVESAVAYFLRYGSSMVGEFEQPLVQAIQAHLAAQGGAK